MPAGNYFANFFLVGAGYNGFNSTNLVGVSGGIGASYSFNTVNINNNVPSNLSVTNIAQSGGNSTSIVLNSNSYNSSVYPGNAGGAGGYVNVVQPEFCKGQPGTSASVFYLDNLTFYYSAGGGGGGLGWSSITNEAIGGPGGFGGAGSGGKGGNSSITGSGFAGSNAVTTIINNNTYYCGGGGGGAGGSGSNFIAANQGYEVYGGKGSPGKVIVYL
jgi:hypothetical protein